MFPVADPDVYSCQFWEENHVFGGSPRAQQPYPSILNILHRKPHNYFVWFYFFFWRIIPRNLYVIKSVEVGRKAWQRSIKFYANRCRRSTSWQVQVFLLRDFSILTNITSIIRLETYLTLTMPFNFFRLICLNSLSLFTFWHQLWNYDFFILRKNLLITSLHLLWK